MTKYVYRFGGDANDGGKGDKNLLGGKGANLDGMASIGLPVPPGFTITTEMCTRYYADGEVFPDSLREEVKAGIAWYKERRGLLQFGEFRRLLSGAGAGGRGEAGGPQARDQRARARSGELGGQERLLFEHGHHPGVGEEAEEARGEGQRIRALAQPLADGGGSAHAGDSDGYRRRGPLAMPRTVPRERACRRACA